MIEQELKLCWLGDPPDLQSLLGAPEQTLSLANTYFDTPDGQLAQGGFGLRLRQQGEQIEQTLKGPAPNQDGVVVRQEWNWDRDRFVVDVGLLPMEVADLVQVSSNQVRRQVWNCKGCEVVLDQGEVRVGDRSSPIAEIEIEAKSEDWSAVLSLAYELASYFPCYIGSISKAERGHLLAGRASPPDRSPLDALGRALDPIKGPYWSLALSAANALSPAIADRIRARDANVASLCLAEVLKAQQS